MNGEMTHMSVEEAVNAIQTYKKETGKTQTIIAKELDVSSALLSSFLAGTYKTPHTLVPKIEQLLDIAEQKEIAPVEPSFVNTTVSTVVMSMIGYSHVQGKITVIYGDAGVGKTMAINEYCKQNSLAIKITVDSIYSSMSGVDELIAEEIGVRERGSRRIYSEIISKLKNSGRVLIIDEAQHLTVRTLDHIRCLAEKSEIGVALVGNETIYTKMKGSGKSDLAQLFSRMGMHKQVLTSTNNKADVKKVFSDISEDNEAVELLYSISQTAYGLRGAVNVYINTLMTFRNIDAPKIARMAKEMNIGG